MSKIVHIIHTELEEVKEIEHISSGNFASGTPYICFKILLVFKNGSEENYQMVIRKNKENKWELERGVFQERNLYQIMLSYQTKDLYEKILLNDKRIRLYFLTK